MNKRKVKKPRQASAVHTVPLPDTSKWKPRRKATETLENAFAHRCLASEKLIQLRSKLESQMNIDNFDSGIALEEIIRNEFSTLLPERYYISAGTINDPEGQTAGDFDLVIFNRLWFPRIKSGPTPESRRTHFPIDGLYGVGEIKQTLDFKTLDSAMKKLVICHRLKRRRTYAYRLVENRESSSCHHGLTNPLYSFILATNLREGVEMDDIVTRFFYINKSLKRHEVIRALCVLGHGTITWSYFDKNHQMNRDALFMLEDLYEPVFPSYFRVPKLPSAFYPLIVNLMLHLYHSVLAPEDIAGHYGSIQMLHYMFPTPDIVLEPDPEWLQALQISCNEDHEKVLQLQEEAN